MKHLTKQHSHLTHPKFLTTTWLLSTLTFLWASLVWATDIPPAWRDALQDTGTARVIVVLNVPVQPEGTLNEADAIVAQRAEIAQAQQLFLDSLQPQGSAETRLETIPALVMVANSQTLTQLQDNPLVTRLQLDAADEAMAGQTIADQLKELERVYESSHSYAQVTAVTVSPASAREGDVRELMVANFQSIGIITNLSNVASMKRNVRSEVASITIQGIKFNDLNGNGRQDANEMGLPNETIFLRNNTLANSTQGAEGFDTVTTDANGKFWFTGNAGNYTLWTNIPVDWQQTAPVLGTGMVPYTSEVAVGQTVAISFGIRDTSIVTLTVTKTGTGTGQVISSEAAINCGTTCEANYTLNSTVTLTATPTTGNTFTQWSGACTGTTATTTVTLDQAKTCTATFQVIPKYTLTVSKTGTGAGSITGTGITCGSDCTENVVANTPVTLTATATTGSSFTGWSGACTGTNAAVTVTLDQAKSCTATFDKVIPKYTLTVSKTGTGTGNITGTGITCGTDCTEDYNAKTLVTLTATPDTGSKLLSWGGACSGTATTATVTMTTAKTCTANFVPANVTTFTLTVAKAGKGQGTIRAKVTSPINQTPLPPVITCKTTCSTSSLDYSLNNVVTITATPDTGFTFKEWSCDGSYQQTGTPSMIKVTMDIAKTCTATFE